jgi:hypothetical protein
MNECSHFYYTRSHDLEKYKVIRSAAAAAAPGTPDRGGDP